MIAALILACLPQSPQHLELYRGASVQALTGSKYQYWAVEDTTLDSASPDQPLGSESILQGGPNKTILIQFKDLNRLLGPFKKIKSASLQFTLTGGSNPRLVSCGNVLAPWNEGPMQSMASAIDKADPVGTKWAATWKNRRSQGTPIPWVQAGASSESDASSIQGIKISQMADTVTIEGLATALQGQYERWYDNNGFALRFDNSVEFLSSNATEGRPKLVLDVEDASPTTGPDLSVVTIDRTPEYERYDSANASAVKEQGGQQIPVMDKVANGASKKWPFEGDVLTYTAHIKNVGDAPAVGFSSQWFIHEKPGVAEDHSGITLQPGEETTVKITQPFSNIHSDHRVLPIGLKVIPKGADAIAANNYLEIQEAALNMGIYVEKSAYDEFAKQPNMIGSKSFEDWIQQQFRIWNNVFFAYSRFSFAPDGIVERVRIQKIAVVPDGSLSGPARTPGGKTDLNCDGEWGITRADVDDRMPADRTLFQQLGKQLGLVDLSTMNIPAGSAKVVVKDRNQQVTRGFMDRFPGLMGGGDTRSDAILMRSFQFPYEPYIDPTTDVTKMEPTDLYSATDAAAFSSNMGRRRGYVGDSLYDMPVRILLTALDYSGKKLANADLTFYQMANGVITDQAPAFNVKTGPTGTALLPNREPLTDGPNFVTLTGHTLKPNPFGRLDTSGANGVFLVKGVWNGTTEWAFLKAWQISDAFHRGQNGIALMNMRFNMPSDPLDFTEDLAKGRGATDSSGSAALTPLTDAAYDKEVSLGTKPGDWVEIDLGRDRPVGEVRLGAASPDFWQSFEIQTYQTGQTAAEARVWTQELDWAWTVANRRDVDPKKAGVSFVSYRAPAQRVRFIRIVNKSKTVSTAAKLAEIEVFGISVGP